MHFTLTSILVTSTLSLRFLSQDIIIGKASTIYYTLKIIYYTTSLTASWWDFSVRQITEKFPIWFIFPVARHSSVQGFQFVGAVVSRPARDNFCAVGGHGPGQTADKSYGIHIAGDTEGSELFCFSCLHRH